MIPMDPMDRAELYARELPEAVLQRAHSDLTMSALMAAPGSTAERLSGWYRDAAGAEFTGRSDLGVKPASPGQHGKG